MVSRITGKDSFVNANLNLIKDVTFEKDNKINSVDMQNSQSINIEILPAEKALKMTESINRFMETTNTNLRFQYHEALKEYYVTIVDSKTNELVKEIPSKKLMDIYAAMRDFLGLMVDHKI